MNNKSQIFKIFLLVLISVQFGCNSRSDLNNSILEQENPFQTLIDSVVVSDDAIAGIILHIESPDLNVSWTGTSGADRIDSDSNLKPSQPFRIASVTKTYVATTILLLAEKNQINIDDSIGFYLSKERIELLKRDGYQTEKISVRNLLNHTSGIFDYAMSEAYFNKILENPNHVWSRSEQLEVAIQHGKPIANPNEQYNYSDTGYILLGEIIEIVTGKSLATSLRDLIGFKNSGLNATWTESMESKPNGLPDIVHPYFDGMDFYAFDPSIDLYGGGGLVSTASDLAIFFQTLFTNGIFEKRSTLDMMLTRTALNNGEPAAQDYRIGIDVFEINEYTIYSHSGFWGTLAAYIPELNSTVAVNFTNGYNRELLTKCVLILEELKNN